MSANFDRLRPRTSAPTPVDAETPGAAVDREGKRALFSSDPPATPAFGSVLVECSRCGETSVLSVRQAARAAMGGSLHLPGIKRHHPSWLRCPACRQRTWCRLTIRL